MNIIAHFYKAILFFIFLIIIAPLSSNSQDYSKTSREEFNEFIMNHPFMVREKLTKEEIKKIPKRDRPDLAWEQDFLTTLDPSTGKPEKSRLFPTLDVIDQMKSALTPAVPGSSTTSAWAERGPNNVAGRTRALVWDPNDATGKKVWAGGVTGGLWYNNDITSTSSQWQSVNDFWDNIAITCIAFDPINSQIMYVGTGEGFGASASRGAGIWKSTNAGSTWARLASTTNFYYVNDLVVRNESNTSVVYAAVDGNFYNGAWHGAADAGLQRSTNGGLTWTQVLPNTPSSSINFVASDIEIGANNRIWIGSKASPYGATDKGGGYILYSDNGTTWTTAYSATVSNGDGRVELACAPSNANYVYALIENQNQIHEIKKTTNGGSSWTSLSEPNDDDLGIPSTDFSRGQAWYDLIAAVDPNDPNKVIVGAINAHMSTNGGTSWSQISKWSNNSNMGSQPYSYIHADHHNIVFKPGSSSEVIFGTDGGVSWTNNLANAAISAVFQDRNNGYNVTQFYAGGLNPLAGSNIMVAGAQDNGSQRYSSTGVNSTTEISGGDGAYCFIDQTDGIGVVTSYVYNNYYYHNNSGANYVRKIIDNSDAGMFINPADLDDANNILYTSLRAGEIYKLSNYNLSSYSLDSILITGLGGMPTAIKVSPFSSSANVYVGDVSGNLVKINNANGSNPTFTNLTATAFPNGTISSIEFGTSESEIIVTFKNYGVTSVYYSSNGGTTWASKEGNLPDMPVRWALINPNNTDEVILATEVGVWATTNFSATSPSWTPSNSGLANVRVDMLQYRSSDNTVMAITHGRGVFTSNAWNTSSTSQLPLRNISEIKGVDANGIPDSLNYACKIRGIVTSIDYDGNNGYNFFVQDATGGIYIYSPVDLNNYQVSIGDDIRLIGDIQQFNGLTEFVPDSIAFISSNNQVPSPQWLYSIDESSEGNLIQLNYCQLVNPSTWPTTAGNHNIDIITGNGDTVIMRLDFDANLIPGLNPPTGYFSVVGCQSQFDNTSPYFDGRQVFPRFISDIFPSVSVRFSVDMNNDTVSSNGIHLAGNFSNGNPSLPFWSPNGIQLFDSSGTGVYETVLNLTQGYYEFKFINGNQWGFDEVITGCNAVGSTNRFGVFSGDTTLPAFCFESCSVCPQGDTLYSFDFASGIPTGWSNTGSSTNALWEYRGPNTTPSNNTGSRGAYAGAFGPINSSTTNNGFMIFDSDYLDDPNGAGGTGQSPAPHVGGLYTEALNFANQQNVILQFESFFRTYESAAGVAFSTDGGLTYPDTVYVHDNLFVNQASGNREVIRLDISSYIGGQPNVKIAFVFDGRNPLGLNGGQFQRSYYFWAIDDIAFLKKPQNDLIAYDVSVKQPNTVGEHYAIPNFLFNPWELTGRVINKGSNQATNVSLYCQTESGSNSFIPDFVSNPQAVLNSGDTSNVYNYASFFFNNIDTYDLIFYPTSDSTDNFTEEDTIYSSVEVTNNEYRLHRNVWSSAFGTNFNIGLGSADSLVAVNEFYFSQQAQLNQLTIDIGSISRVGAEIIPVVYKGNFGLGFNEVYKGSPYTLTATDTGNFNAFIPANFVIDTGLYYVGVIMNSNNNANNVSIIDDESYPQNQAASIIRLGGNWYYNGNAFHVILNLSPAPTLAQIDLPITWDDSANVDYTVTDFSGTTSSLSSDPLNASNVVLKTDKTSTGQPWQGTTLSTTAGLATAIPFAQGATTITAVVYSPDSGITVRLKAEDASNAQIFVETDMLTTKANAWDTLIFDFSNPASTALNFANTYNLLSIFYDFNNNPTTTKTYYVDDIYFGGTPPVQSYNVTFQVDMKNVLQSYTTPELNGTFNGWCGNCTQMSDANNDSIWDVTIQLPAGSYEYKFAADNWGIDEVLSQGTFCTVTNGGFTNRILNVSGDTVLPAVCWASCNTCPTVQPAVYNVTFQVDMQNVTAAFTTPELNGTFNNWCGNCTAMTDVNNDNIWEVTVQLNAGSIEYKFSADAWSIQEQLSPGLSCVITTGGFTNRAFTVTGDTTLPVVCWESCQACIPNCPQITLSATQTLVSCFGGNDGSLTAYASGGVAPYTYDWGFAQGQTITGLASNSYQVIATDSNGCADTAFFTLNQPTGPITSQANGSLPILKINNPNGTSYLMDFGFMDTTSWGTTLNTSSASGQLVVARDSTLADSLVCSTGLANASALNGNIAVVYRGSCEFGAKALACQNAGATGVIIINNSNGNVNLFGGLVGNQVTIPVLKVTQNNGQVLRNLLKNGGTVFMGAGTNAPVEPLCNGNQNGSIELNVNGGTSPYSYQWSNNQGSRGISGIGAGNYSYTITDANGCNYNNSVTLSEPQTLQVGFNAAQNPTSAQANNGSISVNVSGGTMPYSYIWNSIPAQVTDTAINLGVGNYTVTVTDNNLCTDVFSYSLCANDTTTSSLEICQGDTAFIFGNPQTVSGNYYQTYTSNAGCDSVIEVNLTVNNNPIIGGVNVTQVTGCGTNDGSINLQGFGAGTITYVLNTGQAQVGNGFFTNLFPATYVVTVADTNGCTNKTGQLTINPFTGSPSQPTIAGSNSYNYCFGDAIQTLTATGGVGTLFWYDDASLSNPIDSGSTFTPPSALGLNVYYVAEFANNCQSPPAQVFVEINAVPNAPVLSGGATYCDTDPILPLFAQGVGVTWYGDSALTVAVGSGTQLNISVFANLGVNTVYATSMSAGCESPSSNESVTIIASPNSPTASSTSYCDNESPIALQANLGAGNSARWYSDSTLNNLISVNQSFFPSTTIGSSTFYLTQFDGQCESQGVSVNSTVYQSPVINSVIENDVSSCGLTDGSISVSAQFSNIGSKYSIDNGLTYQPTGSFNNLPAAGYIVHVADTFCSSTYGIATINAPGQPQAPTVIGNDTICSGDSFTGFSASAQGSGILNWYSSPLLGSANLVDTGLVYTPQSVSVGANTYYVTELVGNCEGAAGSVTILVNPLPNVSAGIDQAICDGISATLVATGASTYSWVGLASNDSVSVSPTALTQYTVIGTSSQGCVNSDSVLVSINPLPTVAAGVMPSLCIDNGNFILPKATPNGGQYSGQNIINNTLLVSQAGVGSHPVYYTYTDNNGCTGIDTTAITVNALPNVSLATQSNICANANPVALTGGLPAGGNYSGNGIANGNFDPSAVAGPGVYNVFYSFTDANGCFAADTNTITVDTVPIITWNPFPIICANDAKYTLIEASPSGGIYSGNGVGGSSFDPIAAGGAGAYAISYEFTDGNGCTSTGSQTLNVGVLPIVNLGKDTLLCNNRPTVTLDAGSGSSFEWFLDGISTGNTSKTITADSSTSGTYSVLVTNADGCTGSDTVVVSYESICLGVTLLSQIDAVVNIFPNPNSGKFVLEVSGNKANNLEVEIYSASGQIVYYNAYGQLSFIREEVDLGNLAGGVYFLTIKTEKAASKYKLIVN